MMGSKDINIDIKEKWRVMKMIPAEISMCQINMIRAGMHRDISKRIREHNAKVRTRVKKRNGRLAIDIKQQ